MLLYPGGIPWLEMGVQRPDFLKVAKSSAGTAWTTLWKRKKQTLTQRKCNQVLVIITDVHTQENTWTPNDRCTSLYRGHIFSWARKCTSIIPALEGMRQGDQELKVILSYKQKF